MNRRLKLIISLTLLTASVHAQKKPKPLPPVSQDASGRLVYIPDAQGNRVPDFSYCGYMASEQPIPHVPVRMVVPLLKGDATLPIQAALDHVAALPPDAEGFRGAVLLEP